MRSFEAVRLKGCSWHHSRKSLALRWYRSRDLNPNEFKDRAARCATEHKISVLCSVGVFRVRVRKTVQSKREPQVGERSRRVHSTQEHDCT